MVLWVVLVVLGLALAVLGMVLVVLAVVVMLPVLPQGRILGSSQYCPRDEYWGAPYKAFLRSL